ncbi:hypothetical protein KKB99_02760, partial [bacterium]|nr:hypothetical protein [bacterium]MBU1024909.1 hypothetical protein [bacterium]
GNFVNLNNKTIIWRLKTLDNYLIKRRDSIDRKYTLGIAGTFDQAEAIKELMENSPLWILVSTDEQKEDLITEIKRISLVHEVEVFSNNEITKEVDEYLLESKI